MLTNVAHEMYLFHFNFLCSQKIADMVVKLYFVNHANNYPVV